MLGYIVEKVRVLFVFFPHSLCKPLSTFSLQLSQQTKHRAFTKAATSAYRSRSPAWCGSRPSSPGWAWPRGWPWWVSAAGCTAVTAAGSSWDTTPRLSPTLQQVIPVAFRIAHHSERGWTLVKRRSPAFACAVWWSSLIVPVFIAEATSSLLRASV